MKVFYGVYCPWSLITDDDVEHENCPHCGKSIRTVVGSNEDISWLIGEWDSRRRRMMLDSHITDKPLYLNLNEFHWSKRKKEELNNE